VEGLRIALFTDTYPPQVNGVARTLDRFIPAIEARGAEVRVATIADPDASQDPRVERWPSIPFWAYPQLRIASPSRSRGLDLVERWKPDIVHSLTEFGVGLGGLVAATERRVPFVSSYHTHFTAYLRHYNLSALDAIGWPFLRWFHNAGRMTWAPSGIVAQELRDNGFNNVRVWSRGVDHSAFNPAFRSPELRAALGAPSDDVMLVSYVGRLAPEKGIDVAIEGMRLVLERNRGKVVFALAGDGPGEARYRATAPPATVFTGRLTGRALSEFYASADILLFPSITETFGNVVLEAMASGPALIAPDWGATTELATPETSLQFRAQEPLALADSVERLMADAGLRRRLSSAALEVAQGRTWDAVFDRLLGDYLDVLGRRSGAPAA
jgi:phosphatidylinositol alpha 1,6-mannosyltransferase